MAEIKFSPEAVKDLQQTKAYITDELLSEQAGFYANFVRNSTKRIMNRLFYLYFNLKTASV